MKYYGKIQDPKDLVTKEYTDQKYTKPTTGIPDTDLSTEVQASLDKADTALQSVPATYRTAAAQDVIDQIQTAAINKLDGNANYLDSITYKLPKDEQEGTSLWVQGTINYITGTNINQTIRLKPKNFFYTESPTDNFSEIRTKQGYEFSVLIFNTSENYLGVITPNETIEKCTSVKWHTSFVPISSNYKYKFIIRNANNTNADITIQEGYDNIIITKPINNRISEIENLTLVSEPVEPIETLSDSLYNFVNRRFDTGVTGGAKAIKYEIEDGCKYYVTSGVLANDTYSIIQFYNKFSGYISALFANNQGIFSPTYDVDITPKIPSGAKYFIVNYRDPNEELTQPYSVRKVYQAKTPKEISILFVGNSLTQDGIAYLPYLLKTYFPEVRFKFYIFYKGGYNLSQFYQLFNNDGSCDILSVADNSASWSNITNNSIKMSTVLRLYRPDIVCMQEYFNYKSDYTDTTDWDNCERYIREHYTGNNGLKFVSLFHAPLRSNADNVFELSKAGNAKILRETIAEDMIPMGIAIYRALSTTLDTLGDESHLSNDGTHAQEGLPCLLQAYVALLWLFDQLAISKSIYGLSLKMTTEIYNTLNIPGPNLGTGVIEGTDEQNILAQKIAIQAYKEGKKFVINNLRADRDKVVTVTGTTPTINALPGIRYICGEVATLDLTLPVSGICDVVFESGSTATVLTITPPTGVTLRWANGFDPTALEANTTYEINVCDGLGVAGQWT